MLGFRQSLASKAIAAGIVLYLAYVVSIGGDFMTGRFLTATLLAAAVIIARTRMSNVETALVAVAVLGLGAISLPATIMSGGKYFDQAMYQTGINDERGFMFPGRGLITTTRNFFAQPEWPDVDGVRTVNAQCGLLGSAALYAGPGTHYIDTCALADPLLARLPAKHDSDWRIRHFEREIPAAYAQSILKNENFLTDQRRDYWRSSGRRREEPLPMSQTLNRRPVASWTRRSRSKGDVMANESGLGVVEVKSFRGQEFPPRERRSPARTQADV